MTTTRPHNVFYVQTIPSVPGTYLKLKKRLNYVGASFVMVSATFLTFNQFVKNKRVYVEPFHVILNALE